uniref:Uncharacterized protein n=1 Tax=Plectus sambesii TaxID=2011161 RepID=A0A914VWP8_9BILA
MALPSDRPDERYHSDGCDLHVFGDDDGGGEKSDPRRRADTVPGRDKRSEVDRPPLIAVVSQLTDWVIADGDIPLLAVIPLRSYTTKVPTANNCLLLIDI